MQNINCHHPRACLALVLATVRARSLAITLPGKLCILLILLVKYLLLITYYPTDGFSLFSRLYGQTPGSVYLFLGFGSGVGMDGIIHLFPFIEKSNFLIEISIYSGFFFPCIGWSPGNEVPFFVTHTCINPPRPHPHRPRKAARAYCCLTISHTTWFGLNLHGAGH